jgi:hypothetical protein
MTTSTVVAQSEKPTPSFVRDQSALFVLATFTFGTSNAKKIAQVMGLGESQVAELEAYIASLSEDDELPLDLPHPMTWRVLLGKRTKKMCTRFLMNNARLKRVQVCLLPWLGVLDLKCWINCGGPPHARLTRTRLP